MKEDALDKGSSGRARTCLIPVLAVGILLLLPAQQVAQGSQAVIENPARPPAPNAGRTVELKEAWRISDDGRDLVFINPRYLTLSANGSLFILNNPSVLKFSPEGQLVFVIVQKGQGPKESLVTSSMWISDDRLGVLSFNPPKVLEYGLDGAFKSEERLNEPQTFYFLAKAGGRLFGIRDEVRHSKVIFENGFVEASCRLYEISDGFRTLKPVHDFPVPYYIKDRHWWRRGMFLARTDGRSLYVVRSAEYRVERFDLASRTVDLVFSRPYKRRRIDRHEDREPERSERGLRPPPETHYFDIMGLAVAGGRVWVFTSTEREEGRQRLVDIFDRDGRYLDSYFLRFPLGTARHFVADAVIGQDGSLLLVEEDDEGLLSIVKYKGLEATQAKSSGRHEGRGR
ncbi:MAG: 6-bladed beta-propeller [Candidatus Aminicenantes bacterium]